MTNIKYRAVSSCCDAMIYGGSGNAKSETYICGRCKKESSDFNYVIPKKDYEKLQQAKIDVSLMEEDYKKKMQVLKAFEELLEIAKKNNKSYYK